MDSEDEAHRETADTLLSNLGPQIGELGRSIDAITEAMTRINPRPFFVDEGNVIHLHSHCAELFGEQLLLKKSRGEKVQQREKILERRRVDDVVRLAREDGWITAMGDTEPDDCPVCRESPAPLWPDPIGVRLACCGKFLCTACHRGMESRGMGQCPLCRAAPPQSEEELSARYREQADGGAAWAQASVGHEFQERGDLAAAAHWYALAAEQGDFFAQGQLGELYMAGDGGLQQSTPEAKRLLLAAARQGAADAQKRLADILSDEGDDLEEAFRLYTLAAAQKHEHAIAQLGSIYYCGTRPCDVSYERARYWLMEAANMGNVYAQTELASLIPDHAHAQYGHSGIAGVSAISEAAKWLRKAAEPKENSDDADISAALRLLEDLLSVPKNQCGYCSRPRSDTPLLRCARCRVMHYCDKECQTRHWRLGHKRDCVKQ